MASSRNYRYVSARRFSTSTPCATLRRYFIKLIHLPQSNPRAQVKLKKTVALQAPQGGCPGTACPLYMSTLISCICKAKINSLSIDRARAHTREFFLYTSCLLFCWHAVDHCFVRMFFFWGWLAQLRECGGFFFA